MIKKYYNRNQLRAKEATYITSITYHDPKYDALASAIILQAVKDYRSALNAEEDNARAQRVLNDCEKFFLSTWFTYLTDIDGDYLLERLKRGE